MIEKNNTGLCLFFFFPLTVFKQSYISREVNDFCKIEVSLTLDHTSGEVIVFFPF